MANHLSTTNPALSITPLKEQARNMKVPCWGNMSWETRDCSNAFLDTENLTVNTRYRFNMTMVDISARCPVCGEDQEVLTADARDGDTVWTIDTDL